MIENIEMKKQKDCVESNFAESHIKESIESEGLVIRRIITTSGGLDRLKRVHFLVKDENTEIILRSRSDVVRFLDTRNRLEARGHLIKRKDLKRLGGWI